MLPIGCPTAFPKPVDAWCTTPAPSAELDGAWERAVRWWRAAPQALLEPWAGAVVNSIETVRAFRAEVGDVRLLVDTGHVADWGGDPCELLELADHVQLRQGKPGHTQLHVDDPTGVVDFAAVFRDARPLDYRGKVSVEYFDLPDNGWPTRRPGAVGVRSRRPVAPTQRVARPGQVGSASPGVGIPSNATRSPGSASATNSVRRSCPPKQQFVVSP